MATLRLERIEWVILRAFDWDSFATSALRQQRFKVRLFNCSFALIILENGRAVPRMGHCRWR